MFRKIKKPSTHCLPPKSTKTALIPIFKDGEFPKVAFGDFGCPNWSPDELHNVKKSRYS
jgi:hypothetical protein